MISSKTEPVTFRYVLFENKTMVCRGVWDWEHVIDCHTSWKSHTKISASKQHMNTVGKQTGTLEVSTCILIVSHVK